MRLTFLLLIPLLGWTDPLILEVPAPAHRIVDGSLVVEDGDWTRAPGAPRLPCRYLTIAVPPGAIVDSVEFHGAREASASLSIPPVGPVLPLSGGDALRSVMESFETRRAEYYSSDRVFPEELGALLTRGGLRKYTLVTVACYHFAYRPAAERLYYTPNIRVEIQYRMPAPGSERAAFWQNLIDDATFDDLAKEIIYNWRDARNWYGTDNATIAKGYTIITPDSLQDAVGELAKYRKSQGYDVNIVTREYIESNVAGIDIPQKIRYYLRDHMAEIEYALLVGFSTDMPWRSLVPFNNDPNSPYNHPDYSPIPGDLYYAELTDLDSVSWNSDGDAYFGEVYNNQFLPPGDDDPDYHADIHLGRIPFSKRKMIKEICEKTIAFDRNTDHSYKSASLLAGAIYYFANENNSGNKRIDGADFTEQLLNDSVLDPFNAVTLYEAAGLNPSIHPCTDSLTNYNMIKYWQRKGVMYECHHGAADRYARKIWAWDDGDNIPETNEIQWPTCLHVNDVYLLDNAYPATTYLRSCLCGKPEVEGLGSLLLHHGSSAVISSSRVAWMSSQDPGGMPYHFLENLMTDQRPRRGIIGAAHDHSRIKFMKATGFWIPPYHYNLFGDPALRQYGSRRILLYEPPPSK